MKRVAVFIPGGVGDPATSMHVPAQVELISRLSVCHDMTVYSVIKPDGNDRPFRCGKAEVKFVGARYDAPIGMMLFHYLKSFSQDHRKKRFDLIHGFWGLPTGAIAVMAGKLLGLPTVVSVQGGEAASLPDIDYGNMRKLSSRYLTLWTCRQAGSLTALTEFQRRELARFGLHRDDVSVVPYGPPDSFFAAFDRKALDLPVRLLSVGHLNAVKDHHTALNVFRRISEVVDARLRIVGEDFLGGAIQRHAREIGIADRVEFTGHRPHGELAEQYRWAHILLHTARYEGQGAVIAEAAAAGAVVCGTRVGLIADLEPDGAVAVDVGDVEGLAQAILNLLGDPSRYQNLRSSAHKWAMEHPSSHTAAEIQRIYGSGVND